MNGNGFFRDVRVRWKRLHMRSRDITILKGPTKDGNCSLPAEEEPFFYSDFGDVTVGDSNIFTPIAWFFLKIYFVLQLFSCCTLCITVAFFAFLSQMFTWNFDVSGLLAAVIQINFLLPWQFNQINRIWLADSCVFVPLLKLANRILSQIYLLETIEQENLCFAKRTERVWTDFNNLLTSESPVNQLESPHVHRAASLQQPVVTQVQFSDSRQELDSRTEVRTLILTLICILIWLKSEWNGSVVNRSVQTWESTQTGGSSFLIFSWMWQSWNV